MLARTIFACDPQPIVLEGLRRVLVDCQDLELTGAAASPAEALPLVEARQPDVLLADHGGGLRAALQFIAEARRVSPHSQPVLWVDERAAVEPFQALQAGVRGIVKKTLPVATLLECLRAVAQGNIWIENSISPHVVGFPDRRNTPRLTARELDVVRLVCRGLKNKQIAAELSITAGTVKVHLMHIFEKTGVKDRFELALRGRKRAETELEGEGLEFPVVGHG